MKLLGLDIEKTYIDRKKIEIMKTNIILIGFMGAGKTEIGRTLAKNEGFNFIDIDYLIEKNEGAAIAEIFKRKGESYFRNLETEILKEIDKNKPDISKTSEKYIYREKQAGDSKHNIIISGRDKPWVISTGGGMPAFNGNIKLLKNIGTVIYLKADARTIYERIKSETHRPVLGADGFTLKSVSDKLSEREKIYEKADITIYTEGLTPLSVAEEIKILLN